MTDQLETVYFIDSHRRMPNGRLCNKRACWFPTPSCRMNGGCTGKTDADYAEWCAREEAAVRRRTAEAEQAAENERRTRAEIEAAIGEMLLQFGLTVDDLRYSISKCL